MSSEDAVSLSSWQESALSSVQSSGMQGRGRNELNECQNERRTPGMQKAVEDKVDAKTQLSAIRNQILHALQDSGCSGWGSRWWLE